MPNPLSESTVEQAALAWLEDLGYQILSGPDVAPDEPTAERESYGQVVLERRLREALQRPNPQMPSETLEEAFRKLTRPDSPSLVGNNHALHRMLVEGIGVEVERVDGSRGHEPVWAVDIQEPENNEFLAVNQFTVVEDTHERRPDVVLFVNGLPLAVIELKNPADQDADIRKAGRRGEKLGLTDDEVAFYDALEVNDRAVAVLGDGTLRLIAQELVTAVRNSVTIDWTVRENVRAQMRVIIKRILRRYGYPPDKQARATELVLEQAAALCEHWTTQDVSPPSP